MARQELTSGTLCGVWPALIAPWTEDDRLDEERFRSEVRSYAGTGVAGVYTGGTTGEFYAQDDATFERIAAIACEEAHSAGLPVQIGCTALSSRTVCRRILAACAAGTDGIQLALPFWLELKDDEVLRFFAAAADAAGEVPLILYQTERAKRRIAPPLLAELVSRHRTLIGMKETGASVDELGRILDAVPGFSVFGGERDLVEKMKAGGRGTYSSVAGLNAGFVVELYELCAAGRYEDARPLQDLLERYFAEVLIPMASEDGLLDSAIDRVQRLAGGGDAGLRCQGPYRSASEEHVERLKSWCVRNAPLLLPPRKPRCQTRNCQDSPDLKGFSPYCPPR
ncbi:MAG: dihydrodipicolinate synthase family protein [Planctomycetes bacterium]|nr:dihydrodipicolinate synthase family protein [Planctomycetota bacterium]